MLPIDGHRSEIEEALRKNQVVIVVGETGSGKTTRLPAYLYEAGFASDGIIGVTEPRRIAATSVARFVAEQLGCELGTEVGFQVRFDNRAQDSALKFMTDGILLREFQVDPDLRKYKAIMVDEAHERSQNIDFILGLLKDLLRRRPELRVVVASATIDAAKFSRYFGNAPIVEVSGRCYPVEVHYEDVVNSFTDLRQLAQLVADKIVTVHRDMGPGDMLVFLPGKDEIHAVLELIEKVPGIVALPAYGGLDQEAQDKIFQNFPGRRKVVVCTNIAETSITVDGVVYVIDSGLIKQTSFHPETGIQSLDTVSHSRAGCDQRKGRAGRTRPGICFRMYDEQDFWSRPEYTEPEIRRVSLAGVVLAMEDIGIPNVENFDFIDPPVRVAFYEAYQTLATLGAITPGKPGLTNLGRQMAQLPLEPRVARMVLEAAKFGCVKEVATIAAFLSASRVFARPKGKELDADLAHARFSNPSSDLLTYLNIWRAYLVANASASWCFQNFLSSKAMAEVENIRRQLFGVLQNCGIDASSSDDQDVISRCVTAGLLCNLLRAVGLRTYAGVFRKDVNNVFIHPGSALFSGFGRTQFIVATEIVATTKQFARNCAEVEVSWLRELAPHLFIEEWTLVSLSEDGQKVLARRAVMLKDGGKVEDEEEEVSFEQAAQIQEENICNARRNGLVEVIFTSRNEFLCYGDGYQTWPHCRAVELRVPYYCEVENFLGRWYARPKFRLLDLPKTLGKPGQAVLTLGGNSVVVEAGPAGVKSTQVEQKPVESQPASSRLTLSLGGAIAQIEVGEQ